MSDQETPRRTALETGIRTEYDYESGLVQITVISSAKYADISLDVARTQLKEILSRIGEPMQEAQPIPRHPSISIDLGPTLPKVSQQHRNSRYTGNPIEPYDYDPGPDF